MPQVYLVIEDGYGEARQPGAVCARQSLESVASGLYSGCAGALLGRQTFLPVVFVLALLKPRSYSREDIVNLSWTLRCGTASCGFFLDKLFGALFAGDRLSPITASSRRSLQNRESRIYEVRLSTRLSFARLVLGCEFARQTPGDSCIPKLGQNISDNLDLDP